MITRREFLRASALGGVLLGMSAQGTKSVAASRTTLKTGLYHDPENLKHPLIGGDDPERLRWIYNRLVSTKLLEELVPVAAIPSDQVREHVLRIHSEAALAIIDSCTRVGPTSLLAVAGVLGAVKAVADNQVTNAFCAIRPPGHHAFDNANKDGSCNGQGFCFLGNVAIAARYAQVVHGFKNILIVDWDYHHGNGTEAAFYDDPTVFFCSTHDYQAYPVTGDPSKFGEGAGLGYNLNINLDHGATDDDFSNAFDEKLFPALAKVNFVPDLILISAGFDSKRNDQLGLFDLTPLGFSRLTLKLMEYAQENCNGRIVSLLEGGYADRDSGNSWNGLATSVAAHVKTLMTKELQDISLPTNPRSPKSNKSSQITITGGLVRLPENVNPWIYATVTTLDGQKIRKYSLTKGQRSLDLQQSGLPAGQYLLQLQSETKLSSVVTFNLL